MISEIYHKIYALEDSEKLKLDHSTTLITDNKDLQSRNFEPVKVLNISNIPSSFPERELVIIETSIEEILDNNDSLKQLLTNIGIDRIIIVVDNEVYSFDDEKNLSYEFTDDAGEILGEYISTKVRLIFQNIPNMSLRNFVLDPELISFKNIRFDLELYSVTTNATSNSQIPFKNLNSLHLFKMTHDFVELLDFESYPSEILGVHYDKSETNKKFTNLKSNEIWGNLSLQGFNDVSNVDFPNLQTISFVSNSAGNDSVSISNVNAPKANVIWMETDNSILNLLDFKLMEDIYNIKLKSTIDYDLAKSQNLEILTNCEWLELKTRSISILNSNFKFDKVKNLYIYTDEPVTIKEHTFINMNMINFTLQKDYVGKLPEFPISSNLKSITFVISSSNIDWTESIDYLRGKLDNVENLDIINQTKEGFPFSREDILEEFPNLKRVMVIEYFKIRLRQE